MRNQSAFTYLAGSSSIHDKEQTSSTLWLGHPLEPASNQEKDRGNFQEYFQKENAYKIGVKFMATT